jgi:hypothetical protein
MASRPEKPAPGAKSPPAKPGRRSLQSKGKPCIIAEIAQPPPRKAALKEIWVQQPEASALTRTTRNALKKELPAPAVQRFQI